MRHLLAACLALCAATATALDLPPIQGSRVTYHAHVEAPEAIVGRAYAAFLRVPRPASTDLVELVAGEALPPGLALDGALGRLSGTPTAAGVYTFALRAGATVALAHLAVWPAGGGSWTPAAYDGPGALPVGFKFYYDATSTVHQAKPAWLSGGGTVPAPSGPPQSFAEPLGSGLTNQPLMVAYPAVAGAPGSVASGRFPVISLMHGNSFAGWHYQEFARIAASWGFIVICPTRLNSSVSSNQLYNEWQLQQRLAYEWLLAEDLRPGSPYQGRIDRDSIAVMGHSWGGATSAWNSMRTPVRAALLLDIISLMNNADDYNHNCDGMFDQSDDYPAIPMMVVKAADFSFNMPSWEWGGSMPGPRFHLTVHNAVHEHFLDAEWRNPWIDFVGNTVVYSPGQWRPDPAVGRAARRLLAHGAIAFFRRYLVGDLAATASLAGPWALRAPDDLSPVHGGSWSAMRPGWAGQVLIDRFRDPTLAANDLARPVANGLGAVVAPSWGRLDLTFAGDATARWVVEQPGYLRLQISRAAGAAAGEVVENLGDAANPFDASAFSHVACEIAQRKGAFQADLPLSVVLRDAAGASASLPIALGAPPRGFRYRWPHSLLLPLAAATGVDRSRLVSLSIRCGTPAAAIAVELADLRFEMLPATANLPPMASERSAATTPATAVAVGLGGSDPEGGAIVWSLAAAPRHGSVAISGATATYTPEAGFQGRDSLLVRASDGVLAGGTATVSISVATAGNRAPVAQDLVISAPRGDAATAITLAGSDADGDALSYIVTGNCPLGGVVYGAAPALQYENYFKTGADSFTYVVDDGKVQSAPATVRITVTGSNAAPTANGQALKVAAGRSRAFTATGYDLEGAALAFRCTVPAHGTISGSSPDFTYTPAVGYSGSDAFSIIASDGQLDSAPAAVSVTVTAANSAPVAGTPAPLTAQETHYQAVYFQHSDADGDPGTALVVTPPAHGQIIEIARVYGSWRGYYIADRGYSGSDSFTWKINDGLLDSALRTTSITCLAGVNWAPAATARSASTLRGVAVDVSLAGSDPDGDRLGYVLAAPPSHGTARINGSILTYTPAVGYTGSDRLAVAAEDWRLRGSAAAVAITVTPPANTPPVAQSQSVSTAEDTAKAITLVATDADGDALTYSIVAGPTHGTLSGSGANRTYTPALNYSGPDSFTCKANDGTVDSATVTVSITVTPVNDAPVNTLAPTIAGTNRVGATLVATPGIWTDVETPSGSLLIAYQWWRADDAGGSNASVIAGATAATYLVAPSDAGKAIRVVVSATDLGQAPSPAATTPAASAWRAAGRAAGGGGAGTVSGGGSAGGCGAGGLGGLLLAGCVLASLRRRRLV